LIVMVLVDLAGADRDGVDRDGVGGSCRC